MFKSRETVFMACKLSLSGFSSERVFRVTQSNKTDYVGAAPVHYCWTEEGARLSDGQPARGNSVAGLVQGIVISNGGDLARVQTPDGESIQVLTSALKRRVDVNPEPYPNVPV